MTTDLPRLRLQVYTHSDAAHFDAAHSDAAPSMVARRGPLAAGLSRHDG